MSEPPLPPIDDWVALTRLAARSMAAIGLAVSLAALVGVAGEM